LKSGKSSMPGQVVLSGVPLPLNILNIWSTSESPWKSGLRLAISTMMQPVDQMSTLKSYLFLPMRISGDRYHKVTTSCVRVFIGNSKLRASPKSHILMSWVSWLINTFCGFKSRCTMRRLWQYTNESKIC